MCNRHILRICVSKLRIPRRTLIKCILIVCDSAGNPAIICTNYWFKQCFFILATTVSGSGFSSGRWCGTVWISDDLRVYSQWYNNHNNIQWDLNESNRNIHDIYRVYVFGPVTGTLHAVSPIINSDKTCTGGIHTLVIHLCYGDRDRYRTWPAHCKLKDIRGMCPQDRLQRFTSKQNWCNLLVYYSQFAIAIHMGSILEVFFNTVKPVCNDHLHNKIYYQWSIQ